LSYFIRPQNLTGVGLVVPNLIETPRYPGHDKISLPSGVGKGSIGIGVEIFKALLSGRAHVVVTTSCCSHATPEYDQEIFQGFGSRASALVVVLFIKAGLRAEC
jgi:3-oxoacyl-ACP reductase-like protein